MLYKNLFFLPWTIFFPHLRWARESGEQRSHREPKVKTGHGWQAVEHLKDRQVLRMSHLVYAKEVKRTVSSQQRLGSEERRLQHVGCLHYQHVFQSPQILRPEALVQLAGGVQVSEIQGEGW